MRKQTRVWILVAISVMAFALNAVSVTCESHWSRDFWTTEHLFTELLIHQEESSRQHHSESETVEGHCADDVGSSDLIPASGAFYATPSLANLPPVQASILQPVVLTLAIPDPAPNPPDKPPAVV